MVRHGRQDQWTRYEHVTVCQCHDEGVSTCVFEVVMKAKKRVEAQASSGEIIAFGYCPGWGVQVLLAYLLFTF